MRKYFNNFGKKKFNSYPGVMSKNTEFGVNVIEREHVSKSKSYVLIARNAYKIETYGDSVNVKVELPGNLYKVKNIFYVDKSIVEN